MRKKLLFIFFLFSSTLPLQAQFDTASAKQQLRQCADSFAIAFLKKDWNQYLQYSNPAMVALMGGQAAFKSTVAGNFAKFTDNAWKQYEIGKILQVVKTKRELQAVVELQSILELNGLYIHTTSSLIGQSWDGGRFWTFFGNEGDRMMALAIKPDLSNEIILPLKKEYSEPVKN